MDFRMPVIHVGAHVWFYENCDCDPDNPMKYAVAATVTRVNPRNADLSLTICGANVHGPKGAVRHVDDPDLVKPANKLMGCWDYMPETRAFYEKETEKRNKIEAQRKAESEARDAAEKKKKETVGAA